METFKTINWYENYKISDLWNIINKDWKFLKPWKIKQGYKIVVLYKNKIPKTLKLHRLVAETFIKRLENKNVVNHKDGNKQNNTTDNLEWVTPSENTIHSFKVLRNKSSQLWKLWKYNSKSIKIWQYNKEGALLKIWYWINETARKLNLDTWHITRVCKWERKTHWWFIFKYI